MLTREDIELAAQTMVRAAEDTARDFALGDVGGEEDFSGQLIGRIKSRVEDLRTPNANWRASSVIEERVDGPLLPTVRLSARQLGSKGRRSEESWSGADIVMVFDAQGPDNHIKKGVLIQAKRLDPGDKLTIRVSRDLKKQCRDMLNLTPASFIFLYSGNGVACVSAASVEATERRDLHELVPFQNFWFFHDFLVCWIGDPRLQATDRASLAELRALTRARNALLVSAAENGIAFEGEFAKG